MRLYHAVPHVIEGDSLNPGTRNINVAAQPDGSLRATFTDYSDKNLPYLFATDNRQLSMTYTVPKGIRLANMHGHGGAEILFLDQEALIGDPDLTGALYSFESDDFIQIHEEEGPIDQWVSSQPVSLHKATVTSVRSINDILAAGVQVYQVSDAKGYSAHDFHQDILSLNDEEIRAFTKKLVTEGKLRWLNDERGIETVDCLVDKDATHKVAGAHTKLSGTVPSLT